MARITYILPTFNRAEHLAKVFLNIREFITAQDELILVDGGSTDGTIPLIKANRDLITVFISEPDISEHHALNKGLLSASGDYIKFLTDDDYFYPDAMRQCIQLLEQHSDIQVLQCGGESYVYDPKTERENFFVNHWLPSTRNFNDGSYDIIENDDYEANGLGLWISKDTFIRVGLFDTTYRAGDSEFITRLIFHQIPFRYLNVKLFKHIVYPHSGVTRPNLLYKNRAHLCFTYRYWDKLLSGHYSIKEAKEAFGPIQWKQIRLLNWAFCGPRFKKIKGLGPLLIFVYHPLSKVLRSLKGLFSKGPEQEVPIAPVWDGSLRS